jgi:hypothetical protein
MLLCLGMEFTLNSFYMNNYESADEIMTQKQLRKIHKVQHHFHFGYLCQVKCATNPPNAERAGLKRAHGKRIIQVRTWLPSFVRSTVFTSRRSSTNAASLSRMVALSSRSTRLL